MVYGFHSYISSWPILDTLQNMTDSLLVNVDNPIPKDYFQISQTTHPRLP